jgi:hypothetical protein
MTSFLVSMTVLLLTFAGIAATFAVSNARAVDNALPPIWLKQYGVVMAIAILIAETSLAVYMLGIAAGSIMVITAWMVGGPIFIATVNAWPKKIFRAAFVGGFVGLSVAAVLIARLQ